MSVWMQYVTVKVDSLPLMGAKIEINYMHHTILLYCSLPKKKIRVLGLYLK